MIIVKTKMKKMPKTCKECRISYIGWEEVRFCGINGKTCPMEQKPSGNWGYSKPSWCPLVEVSDLKES